MWYVVQTTTGKEQELADLVHKMLPKDIYKECFFLKRQLLKRLGGEWLEVTETLFPAYVFLEVERPEKAEKVFYQLKTIPEFTKLLGDGEGDFIPLEAEEERFLQQLCESSRQYLVPLTKVELDNNSDVRNLEGPLEGFKEKIIRLNLRKRYAIIEITIRGEKQTALLGIRIRED